jgi:hypothetical protein
MTLTLNSKQNQRDGKEEEADDLIKIIFLSMEKTNKPMIKLFQSFKLKKIMKISNLRKLTD